jgi:hypothetical protein
MGAKHDKAARARAILTSLESASPENGVQADPSGQDSIVPGVEVRQAEPKANRGHKATFERADKLVIPESHYPKKHAEGSLKRGDSVWYRGERWWVERCHDKWAESCSVRISDVRVHPDLSRLPDKNRTSFNVHADTLDLAPTSGNAYAKQSSMADEARKERTRSGQTDVGDHVAELLRSANSIEELYSIASEFLDIPIRELKDRYGHLNPGQQRMNLGNKMRFKFKKEAGK